MTLTLLSLIVAQSPVRIESVIPNNFRSAEFTAVKTSGNQKELAKINEDFGMSYRFSRTKVTIKEPFMLRLEGKVEDTSAVFVTNGTRKMFKAPRSKLSIKDNTANSPGKRQTVLDFGLVVPSLFTELFDAKFVRTDRSGLAVFDLLYKAKYDYKQRHRVFMDTEKKVPVKREWYAQDGRLMATFFYSGFVQDGGLYFPTTYEVKNADNVVAGGIKYQGLKLNGSVSDSLFEIK